MKVSTEVTYTHSELFDLCRALGTKVGSIERGIASAQRKGLRELESNLNRTLDKWTKLLNKTRAMIDTSPHESFP